MSWSSSLTTSNYTLLCSFAVFILGGCKVVALDLFLEQACPRAKREPEYPALNQRKVESMDFTPLCVAAPLQGLEALLAGPQQMTIREKSMFVVRDVSPNKVINNCSTLSLPWQLPSRMLRNVQV